MQDDQTQRMFSQLEESLITIGSLIILVPTDYTSTSFEQSIFGHRNVDSVNEFNSVPFSLDAGCQLHCKTKRETG